MRVIRRPEKKSLFYLNANGIVLRCRRKNLICEARARLFSSPRFRESFEIKQTKTARFTRDLGGQYRRSIARRVSNVL